MLEILIDNKDGNVWDISGLVSSVSWDTVRIGKPSKLEVTFIKGAIYEDKSFKYNNGDIIRFRKDGMNVFYGYIFDINSGKDELVKVTAYDQLRYLLANDTYVFKNVTAIQVIKQIADDFRLKTGVLSDAGYKIPTLVEDNKKLLDIIYKSLDLTLINTGRNYVLLDDFGEISLRNVEDMKLDFVLGDGSLMYDYDYKRSIDSDTYNRVKIVRNNKKTKRRDVYMAQSNTIGKWGLLQLYQTADENANDAQIKQLLDTLMRVKNRESKIFTIKAIGDIRVRAGCYLPVIIEEIGINQYFLVDECSHSIEGEDHTMTVDLKVI
ncbi:XkdQ/YqbQ family protein [Brevibacillus parabrevis]|jgi:hypothetical protein|uniref:XkdQ/YqbQ family protein n=1 Tax=Brevibacillus parabrevis TaxID=54914 RepID=UPI00249386EB|nr:hypothetical protein [Brevibacillus parabrevis]